MIEGDKRSSRGDPLATDNDKVSPQRAEDDRLGRLIQSGEALTRQWEDFAATSPTSIGEGAIVNAKSSQGEDGNR